jgi:hypothetical protein
MWCARSSGAAYSHWFRLKITAELVDSWGGHLQIGTGSLGGCSVRLVLPQGG